MKIVAIPEDSFVFIGEALLSIVGHPCDCDFCTRQKGDAFQSLVWLISKTTDAPVVVQEEGQPEIPMGWEVGSPSMSGTSVGMPDVVRDAIRLRAHSPDTPEDEREVLMGWLELSRLGGE